MVEVSTIKLARISARGIVQGVGFRPFVYQLAVKHGLTGWVCNTSEDVKIEVEGNNTSIERFLLHGESTVAVRGHPALHLNPYLFAALPWVRVNADEVIPFVVRRCFVGEDVPPHQIAHDKVLGSVTDHRKPGE